MHRLKYDQFEKLSETYNIINQFSSVKMIKLILVMSLAVYVVSLPLPFDANENPHKDDTDKDLPPIPTEQPGDEHKLKKRLDVVSSSYAFAEKEQKEQKDRAKNQGLENDNRHFEKRDTETKESDGKLPTTNQKDRKIRDTHEQPNKSGGSTHDPKKSIGDDHSRHTRSTDEQRDKVPDKHEQQPTSDHKY